MRYYVVADPHGFYTELVNALTEKGYFEDKEPHKLIVCGDLFDRGKETQEMQAFILDLLQKDEVILIRGNHEDLFVSFLNKDCGFPYQHHIHNGTFETALQLTGMDAFEALDENERFVRTAKETPYYTTIIPSMIDYFETNEYIFVHGWIPMNEGTDQQGLLAYNPKWRNASLERWNKARWLNGMDMAKVATEKGKTIVCGHWHCSYGHARFEHKGTEFGDDADYAPYVAEGIIAIDACTARSRKVNCIVLSAKELCDPVKN